MPFICDRASSTDFAGVPIGLLRIPAFLPAKSALGTPFSNGHGGGRPCNREHRLRRGGLAAPPGRMQLGHRHDVLPDREVGMDPRLFGEHADPLPRRDQVGATS